VVTPEAIEAVIFDYGGVLSVSPFGRLAEAERSLRLPPGTLADLFGYGLDVPEPARGESYTNHWHLLEVGAIELDAYAEWVADRSESVLGVRFDPRDRMASGFDTMGIAWPMVHEARRLKDAGYRLAVCSNNIAAYRSTWQAQVPLELFEVVIDSSEVGLRKPDPAIYLLTCDRLGVPPARCVFIDDHPANVEAAVSLGMRGVLSGEDVLATIADLRGVLAAPV
jgi:epoxide hydrolase-like predicted phosphatase